MFKTEVVEKVVGIKVAEIYQTYKEFWRKVSKISGKRNQNKLKKI